MSEMEYRGQDLLDKWLSGDINHHEELELFELAESDRMLKDALEGFIGQNEILPLSAELIKNWQSGEKKIVEEQRRNLFAINRISLVAAVLVVALISTTVFIFITKEGQEAQQFVVDVNVEAPSHKEVSSEKGETILVENELVDNSVNNIEHKVVVAEYVKPKEVFKEVPIITDNAVVAEVVNNDMPQKNGSLVIELPKDLSNVPTTNSNILENEVEQMVAEETLEEELVEIEDDVVVTPDDPTLTTMAENEDFDYEADDVLKYRVESNSRKDLEKEVPITTYDIDIKSGVDPENIGNNIDSIDLSEIARVEGMGNQVDAAGNQKQLKTNNVSNNIVIKEYKIDKRDILNPPMEDYNTLVRAKYKRKAKPSVGYFKYKQHLKDASSILVDVYKEGDYLEDVLIKFRVHKDGSIEFLDLFGVDNQQCVDAVSKAIASGPAWELLEHYEAVDIEVPFKVLFPWMF